MAPCSATVEPASLPVLYTAVGRHLGYPLKLVSSWGPKANHLFCRWDDPAGEALTWKPMKPGSTVLPTTITANMVNTRPREDWPLSCLPNSREEVAGFLMQRAHGWLDVRNRRNAVDAFALAAGMCPDNMACLTTLKMDYNWWLDEVLPLTPPHFPEIRIRIHRRRYPEGLPFDMEAKILGVEAMEAEVKDPGLVFRWAG